MLLVLSCTLFWGCTNLKHVEETANWDCSVYCAEDSGDETYVITYSNSTIISQTGVLSFQNRNDFDVVVHLLANDQEERTVEIAAGGISVLYQINKNVDFTVGIHADVTEGTEIKLMVYDGEKAEVFIEE